MRAAKIQVRLRPEWASLLLGILRSDRDAVETKMSGGDDEVRSQVGCERSPSVYSSCSGKYAKAPRMRNRPRLHQKRSLDSTNWN